MSFSKGLFLRFVREDESGVDDVGAGAKIGVYWNRLGERISCLRLMVGVTKPNDCRTLVNASLAQLMYFCANSTQLNSEK